MNDITFPFFGGDKMSKEYDMPSLNAILWFVQIAFDILVIIWLFALYL